MALVLLAEQKATGANKYTYGLNVGRCAERALPLELSRAPHSPTPPECGECSRLKMAMAGRILGRPLRP